jgi:hypothetical protein
MNHAAPSSLVHPPHAAMALPLLRCAGNRWLRHEGAASILDASQDLLDVLSDLAHFGMVLPLAQVGQGGIFWWPGAPVPEGDATAWQVPRLSAPPPLPQPDPALPAYRLEWRHGGETTDRWRYGVSASARWWAASLGLPLVHGELLSLSAAVDSLPPGHYFLRLGAMKPADFAWLWRAPCWMRVQRRALLLRERRRLALGLGADIADATLNAAIAQHYFIPTVQHLLDQLRPHGQRHFHVRGSAANLDALPSWPLDVGRFASDDPLGDNLGVLASRRIQRQAPVARLRRATGRSLVVLAHKTHHSLATTPPAPSRWAAPLWAALQLDYLLTHPTPLATQEPNDERDRFQHPGSHAACRTRCPPPHRRDV